MKDLVFELVCAAIGVLLTIATPYLLKLIESKTEEITLKSENEYASSMIENATSAVKTAVTYTSQTFVDALKKEGQFSTEKQKEALERATIKTLEIMTDSAAEFITATFGDLNNWITVKIEEAVKLNK